MEPFEFNFPAISAGTTFVFGSWVCIANRLGGFSSHLIDTTSMQMPRQEQLGKTTLAEIILPQVTEETEKLSISNTTSTRCPFGLEDSAASYSAIICRKILNSMVTQTASQFDSYPDSDDNFDSNLLNCSNLTITATPQSRIVYWKNSKTTGPLNNARLETCLRDLPYQSGRPLSPIVEEGVGNIALVDYSTTHSTPERQVYVSIHGDDSTLGSQADQYVNENLDQISDDDLSVNAPQDESQQDKDARRRRNRRRAVRRRNATAQVQRAPAPHGPRNFQRDFDEAVELAFGSPVVNLAEAAILM